MDKVSLVIPNAFTREPKIHISGETSDGRKVYGMFEKAEFEQWLEDDDQDFDDLFPLEEDEDEKRQD